MITKDLKEYAEHHWISFQKTITDISSNGKNSLVNSNTEIYCFDDICLSIFNKNKAPTSADGLSITEKEIELIEFKSGFKRKITKKSFQKEMGFCKEAGKICEDYWKLFFKNQKKEIDELVSSIRNKAVESYITLEKHIFPRCNETNIHMPLKYVVVIDEDEIDYMEDTLSDLAGKGNAQDNHFTSIKRALYRLTNQFDVSGTPYYYDQIVVLSAQDFYYRLQKRNGKSKKPTPECV